MIDWLFFSLVASLVVAAGLIFLLGACWLSGQSDDRDERLIAEIEALRAASMAESCPWPVAHETRGDGLSSGIGTLHSQSSSRLLSGGSESPL